MPSPETRTTDESPAAAPQGGRLRRSDFTFDLPEDLIAQSPSERRDGARLLHVRPAGDGALLEDLLVPDFLGKLRAGDVLVLNDTRVIKARLLGHKSSGGRVEALVERVNSERCADVLLRASHLPRSGSYLRFQGAVADTGHIYGATVRERRDDLFTLEFDAPIDEVLDAIGQLPLPPYIHHAPKDEDLRRYQTVYAREPGAVAAPTAGLHLTRELLAQMEASGVQVVTLTLHVGAGTFQPVRSEDLHEHHMHAERFTIPAATANAVNAARADGRRIVAVGTTSVRALESGMRDGVLCSGPGETSLFILPGFAFQCVDMLLTNFHLPGSTLLMLVSAFAGVERIRHAYAHAIAQRYRFFSYGDAMLLERTLPSLRSASYGGRPGRLPPTGEGS
jgi:S-adenosylmethionine:tRNA ribosyltransferase-isomerase